MDVVEGAAGETMSQLEPKPECRRAEEINALIGRALFTADLSASEKAGLDEHMAACASCRAEYAQLQETHALLTDSYEAAVAPASLMPRIAAKLPLTIPTAASATPSTPGLQVVAVGTRTSSPWRMAFISAAAAAIAVVAGLSLIRNDGAAQVSRGSIVDSDGRVAKSLVAGKTYTVKKEAIVPLSDATLLRLPEGAQFAVQSGSPGMNLQRGDVYAWGKDKQKPTHMALDSFEADLQEGNFFVSAEDGGEPRGVLIVFDGMATVGQADAPLEVTGGHVYVSVKNQTDAFNELLSMAEVLERLQQDISIQNINTSSLREEYARKVAGYDKELKDLTLAVTNEGDPIKKAELQERHVRVQEYRTQHQKRLKSLRTEFPSDQIRRGLDRHLPPDRWM